MLKIKEIVIESTQAETMVFLPLIRKLKDEGQFDYDKGSRIAYHVDYMNDQIKVTNDNYSEWMEFLDFCRSIYQELIPVQQQAVDEMHDVLKDLS